ncbi:aluminum-activated malate transporter 14-like [Rhododendron vialii]|uniref:aluminum-activated malate transporter 14-like n=1 Tax=Rhododendron vialii TaxID=182163 RepID=UPI00265E91CC|nr:aluminum-activated malate transporter 14-like [Rhododendron vialii]XP_058225049.1 aluminum-activated malate transporter 14-like [Rhododendron vialii]XP_058225050.1 aluminum-activated malate transporter 14-like [Rhododendron vialii]XP_058225051.1 aluminum-activated malate transporter 14-like [Rhododendron vialii]
MCRRIFSSTRYERCEQILKNYCSGEKLRRIFQCNSTEESLATFASWDPRHSRYCYPWKQYVHLGTVLRRLAYTAFALHGCLESHVQAPQTVRALFKEPCEHVAEEIVKVLSELAETIKKHHHFSAHISDHLHEALEELDASIKTQHQLFLPSNPTKTEAAKPSEILGSQIRGPEQLKIMNRTTCKTVITGLEFSRALPFSAFVSLLIETAARLDLVIEEVEELAKVAHFKEFHEEDDSIEIKVDEGSSENPKGCKDIQILTGNLMTENLQFLLSKLNRSDK